MKTKEKIEERIVGKVILLFISFIIIIPILFARANNSVFDKYSNVRTALYIYLGILIAMVYYYLFYKLGYVLLLNKVVRATVINKERVKESIRKKNKFTLEYIVKDNSYRTEIITDKNDEIRVGQELELAYNKRWPKFVETPILAEDRIFNILLYVALITIITITLYRIFIIL